jgi:hypothetical protein
MYVRGVPGNGHPYRDPEAAISDFYEFLPVPVVECVQ